MKHYLVFFLSVQIGSLFLFQALVGSTHKQAFVRVGNALCNEEQQFLIQRKTYVKKTLENLLQTTLEDEDVPHIALCCSGGGYRAMIATLGSLEGISISLKRSNSNHLVKSFIQSFIAMLSPMPQQSLSQQEGLGLLNICTYAVALSGSSWALAGLIQSQLSVPEYLEQLALTLNKNLGEDINLPEIIQSILKKYVVKQPLSLIDIYGSLLAQKLLKTSIINKNTITLHAQQSYLQKGRIPLPIYTAITGNDDLPYCWIEYSPYEIGSPGLNAYIPTWAFGRRFDGGISQDFSPPQTLGFALGIWGSGMCINIKEFFNEFIAPITGNVLDIYLEESFNNKLSLNNVLEYRISPAQVFNWTFNTPHTKLNDVEILTLIDAGIDFNIPIPPLLTRERPVDIIIIIDASSGLLGHELYKAENYARKHNLKFPPINYTIINQICSVHQDDVDATSPIVIYIPLIKNEEYQNGWNPHTDPFTATFNFCYTHEQVELLSGLARYNMEMSQPLILETIQEWITTHRRINQRYRIS